MPSVRGMQFPWRATAAWSQTTTPPALMIARYAATIIALLGPRSSTRLSRHHAEVTRERAGNAVHLLHQLRIGQRVRGGDQAWPIRTTAFDPSIQKLDRAIDAVGILELWERKNEVGQLGGWRQIVPVGRYRCAPRGSWLSILNVSFSRQNCRRCPTFEQIARNHDFLHFGCPFIDTQGSNLAIELLDRGPLVTPAPPWISPPGRSPAARLRSRTFCHGRFPGHARGSSVLVQAAQ